jgi:hypothetical protein
MRRLALMICDRKTDSMRSCVRKCSRLLIAFSVALFLTAVGAQAEPPNCAHGDSFACGLTSPSVEPTASGEGRVGSPARLFPDMIPRAPNALMSVYRDDADGIDRTAGPRQLSAGLFKTQPLTEFQMLIAGSIGRFVPDPAAPPEEKSLRMQQNPVTNDKLELLKRSLRSDRLARLKQLKEKVTTQGHVWPEATTRPSSPVLQSRFTSRIPNPSSTRDLC